MFFLQRSPVQIVLPAAQNIDETPEWVTYVIVHLKFTKLEISLIPVQYQVLHLER